ncbi:hypothetical protein PHJA_000658500 [Phtheirospermum japonicum]|uniref:Uncharacterized protein n=1 Tax=Phtheirospermum japonicum TaxID=374723 RepID=A0A830BDE6_9LAMI|nr:hypothetical protein PHJA_000658500 [Phtheirospermum japonicum]
MTVGDSDDRKIRGDEYINKRTRQLLSNTLKVSKNFLRLQKPTNKVAAKSKLKAAKCLTNDSGVRLCSMEEKALRHSKLRLENRRNEISKKLEDLETKLHQVTLEKKLLKLTMKKAKLEEHVYDRDCPMTSLDNDLHDTVLLEKSMGFTKVPQRLFALLREKLMWQFGRSFDRMVIDLHLDLWSQIVLKTRKSVGEGYVFPLTEDEALTGLVQEFELDISTTDAEDILTEVVRKFASNFRAALEETMLERLNNKYTAEEIFLNWPELGKKIYLLKEAIHQTRALGIFVRRQVLEKLAAIKTAKYADGECPSATNYRRNLSVGKLHTNRPRLRTDSFSDNQLQNKNREEEAENHQGAVATAGAQSTSHIKVYVGDDVVYGAGREVSSLQ